MFCPSDNFETCLALPTRWRASVRPLSFWYLFCDPRRWDNSRKAHAPEVRQRVVSATCCHLDATNMDITRVHPFLIHLCMQSILLFIQLMARTLTVFSQTYLLFTLFIHTHIYILVYIYIHIYVCTKYIYFTENRYIFTCFSFWFCWTMHEKQDEG